MKVIFLDIDGVLNSNDWYVKTRGVEGDDEEWEEYDREIYGKGE